MTKLLTKDGKLSPAQKVRTTIWSTCTQSTTLLTPLTPIAHPHILRTAPLPQPQPNSLMPLPRYLPSLLPFSPPLYLTTVIDPPRAPP